MNNRRTELQNEFVDLVDIRSLAGAQAQVVEAHSALFEAVALPLCRRNRDACSAPYAIEVGLRVEQNLHLEEFEQRRPESARSGEIRNGELEMGDTVQLHDRSSALSRN
jgi:hypothetical protein